MSRSRRPTTYGPVTLGLRGAHQAHNAVVAVRLLEATSHHRERMSRDAIEQGLANAQWPARLELIHLDDGYEILLDAAHNPEGARALAEYLHRWHPERPPLVIGVMRDKNVQEIIGTLLARLVGDRSGGANPAGNPGRR